MANEQTTQRIAKRELIRRAANTSKLPQHVAAAAINAFLAEWQLALLNGEQCEFTNFITTQIVQYQKPPEFGKRAKVFWHNNAIYAALKVRLSKAFKARTQRTQQKVKST